MDKTIINTTESQSPFLKRATLVCSAVAMALGALGLVGWISGLRVLASLSPIYIPMAPDTAVIFLVLGSILFSNTVRPLSRRRRLFFGIVTAGIVMYGLAKSIEYFVKIDLTFEDILFPITEQLGSFPIGRMSPLTGTFLLFSGTALLLILWDASRQFTRNLVSGFGILIALAGFVAIMGYLYGTPLLYGGDIIPLAATTSLAFLFLGSGLAAAAGAPNAFLRSWAGESVLAKLLRAFVPLITTAVLIQGLASQVIPGLFQINHALLAAISSLIFIAITSAIVIRVAQVISRDLEISEAKRKRAEEKFSGVLESGPDAMVIVNERGEIVLVNKQTEQLFGYRREELLGKAVEMLAPERMRTNYPSHNSNYFFDTRIRALGLGLDLYGLRKDGTEFPIDVGLSPLETEDGVLVASSIRDVTERKQTQEEIISLARFTSENPRPVMRVSSDGTILYANPASQDWLEAWNTQVGSRVPPDWQESLARVMEAGELEEIEIGIGTQIFAAICTPFVESGYINIYGHDITQRKHSEAKLHYLSMHDALTGLYNRNFFEEELARLEHSRHFPVSVMIADINGLKQINDRLGHSAGDELIRDAARLLKAAFRGEDVVARWGGDEFAVLLPDTDAAAVDHVLTRLKNRIEAENKQRGDAPLSLALGVATGNNDASLKDTLKNADQRMYEDKSDQSNHESAG